MGGKKRGSHKGNIHWGFGDEHQIKALFGDGGTLFLGLISFYWLR